MTSYEVVLDNSKMLANCYDEPPLVFELAIYPENAVEEGSSDSSHVPFLVGTAASLLIDASDASYGWATWINTVKGVYPYWNATTPAEHNDPVIPSTYPEATFLSAGEIDPTWVTKIVCRFRAKSPDEAVVGIQLMANVSKLMTNPSYGAHPTIMLTDTWTNYEWEFDASQYSVGGWAPNGILSALNDMFPGYLYVRTIPLNPANHALAGNYNIQISKQHLVLYHTVPPELIPDDF